MILGLKKPLRHHTLAELHRFSESRAFKLAAGQRKYSVGLLEEAYKLYKLIGLTAAAREAGVNVNSLDHYTQVRRMEEGHKPVPLHGSNRIDPAIKQDCYEMAFKLFKLNWSKSLRRCWIEAGRLCGCVGRSVEFQYGRGLWKPKE